MPLVSGDGADGAGLLVLERLLFLQFPRDPSLDADQVELAVKLASSQRDAAKDKRTGWVRGASLRADIQETSSNGAPLPSLNGARSLCSPEDTLGVTVPRNGGWG